MQIVVQTLDGQTITLHVKRSDTIDTVNAKIFKQGFRIKKQQPLIFEGRQLNDDSTVERCIPLPVIEIGGMGWHGQPRRPWWTGQRGRHGVAWAAWAQAATKDKGDDQQEEEKGGGE